MVQRTNKWPLQAIVNGIFYVLKNGCIWRDMPADLPPWVTVYYYFTKWSADGTWERVSGCLSIVSSGCIYTGCPEPVLHLAFGQAQGMGHVGGSYFGNVLLEIKG